MTEALAVYPRISLKVAALLALCCTTFVVCAADYQLDGIILAGNGKTRDEVLLRELDFSDGMLVSAERIERGRKSIMALGLFTTVETDFFPTTTGHQLLISVQEKYFFLPMPIINRNGDGDWTYGGISQADNLFGLNQQLKVSFRRKDYRNGDIERENQLQVLYRAPAIDSNSLGLELKLHRERALLNEKRKDRVGRYNRLLTSGKFTISLPFGSLESHRRWIISLGLQRQVYDHSLLSGDSGLFYDTNAHTLIVRADKKIVELFLGGRTGYSLGHEIQRTTAAGQTTAQYLFFFKSYQYLSVLNKAQVHTQLRIGICSGSVFGDPCFSLGGDTTIRGIQRGSIEGDIFVLSNTQLLIPLLQRQFLRGVIFLDIGGATDHLNNNEAHKQVVAGVGGGVIWKLRRFVGTDLRIELARGLGAGGKNRIYAATSMLF